MKLFLRLSIFMLSYTVFPTVFAQGSWQPTGADLSFPRTLMKASQIPVVRQSLQNEERKALYISVYGSGTITHPSANSSDSERRYLARLAKNAAFIRLINRKPAANNTLDSLTSAEKTQLQTTVISLLENINTAVSGNALSNTSWQWRSKELIDYLTAYDLLRGAGVPVNNLQTSRAKLQEFTANLYSKATGSFFGIVFLNDNKNNHLLMTAAALGMAGVVLNDGTSTTTASQPQAWINAGMYAIENVMWRDNQRQSEPGVVAGYAEGPYYFKYAMLNCLPFFRAFGNFLPDGNYYFTWNGNTRSIRNPFYDPNYDLLYQWITDISMPDGRFPALEDSYIDMAMPELAITGKPQYLRNFYPQNMDQGQLTSLNAQLDGTVDLRANYLAANVDPLPLTEKTLTVFLSAGNLVFRSGTGFNSNYLHVYGKNGKPLTNSGGHNHGDASSFILYAQGQLLALDAGYLKYDRRGEVGNANNHNLILVDGAGPQIGTTGSANDAQAYIENTFETPELSYGEVRTTYSGANITRKTLSVRGEYFLMADFISAASFHNYTWQLHGFGLESPTSTSGTFTDNTANHEGIWQKNGVSLKAHVTANSGASTYSKNHTFFHEITYDQAQNHTTFLVQKNSVSNTQFLAALQPAAAAAAATTTLSLPNMAGVKTISANYTDVAFTKADTLLKTVSALTNPIQSDANFTFFSVDNSGEFAQLFLQNGKQLYYGTEKVIESSKRANISWQQSSPNEYYGYVNKPATLYVKVAQQPNSVSGANLTSWTYNATTQTLQASFSQPSDFQYKLNPSPLPVEMVRFQAEKINNKVKLTWQTASEKNNKFFRIQCSADGRNWQTIGEKPGQGTTSSLTSYEHFDAPDFSGLIYYRLAQEDFDGTVKFSEAKVVAFEKVYSEALQLYPNPASAVLNLETETYQSGMTQINILDITGQVVYKTEHSLKNGRNRININTAALPAGFYVLSVQTKEQKQQAKFIKR